MCNQVRKACTSLSVGVALAVGTLAGSPASAISVDYQVANSGSSVSATNSGLDIETDISSVFDGTSFSLANGESVTIPFFDIWTDEEEVDDEDEQSQGIEARVEMVLPESTIVRINGETAGDLVFDGQFGEFGHYGKVEWSDSAIVQSPSATYSVQLTDEDFNLGDEDLDEGESGGATVQAKFKQIDSGTPGDVASVPMPNSVWAGLAMLGVVGAAMVPRHIAAQRKC
jgi:hypothetical protein